MKSDKAKAEPIKEPRLSGIVDCHSWLRIEGDRGHTLALIPTDLSRQGWQRLAAVCTEKAGPSVPAAPAASVWLQGICVRFDRLFSFDHSDARKANVDYDEAFHDAVHALKELRQFAGSMKKGL